MKFAQHLSAHITPEWRKQYIEYDEMKAALYKAIEDGPSDAQPDMRVVYVARFEEEFLGSCWRQLQRINSFFKEKLAEATRLLMSLKMELPMPREKSQTGFLNVFNRTLRPKPMNKFHFELAFSELYLKLVLIQNFQQLNYQGFRKILKKHDKLLVTKLGKEWMDQNVEKAIFNTSQEVDGLIVEIEELVTTLEGGNRSKAMKKLRVPPLGHEEGSWATFTLGLFLGISMVIIGEIISSAIDRVDGKQFDWSTIIRLYRGPFLITLYIGFLGLNIHGWNIRGVNHVLIFEFDPRNHLASHDLLEMSAFLNCIWSGSILAFLEHQRLRMPVYTSPLALLIFYLVFLLNPTKTFWFSGRLWFLKHMFRLISSPFHEVSFADFWLADQMSSLTLVLLDFQYTICIYTFSDTLTLNNAVMGPCLKFCTCNSPTSIIRPLLRWSPSLVRLIQCFRRCYDSKGNKSSHLWNAGKYFCSSVIILASVFMSLYDVWHPNIPHYQNPILYVFILVSIISSMYSYYWDVKMDWGFFDPNYGENKYLREEIVYGHKSYYYFGIAEDLILRYTWAASLTIAEAGYISSDIMMSILAPLELFRRFVWNFFRLENEHLNNCGQFRAVRDISVVPAKRRGTVLNPKEVVEIMDQADGMEKVIRRRKSALSNVNIPSSAESPDNLTTVAVHNHKQHAV